MQTIITISGKDIAINISANEASSYVASQIEKLKKRIEVLQGFNEDEQAEEAVKSVLPKLKKIEIEDLLDEYEYSELKFKARGESLASYLAENGIAKSLIGSAERGYKLGMAVYTALTAAGIDDKALLETQVRDAVGRKPKEWLELVIDYIIN